LRILYGVQATGNGHISRAREIVKALKALGHDVRTVLSGRDPSELRELEPFEPWASFRGLSFNFSGGKVQLLNTARRAPFDLMQVWRDVATGIDLVICDFEPVTARVARKHGIPSIGVGHQYAFVFDVPRVRSDPASRYILRNMGAADIPLGLHWHHFGFPILPPIVPDYLKVRPGIPEKVLVYLPFEDNADIVRELRDITSHQFYIYGTKEPTADNRHLHHREYSRDGFLDDLTDCDAVVCNAGFELPGEALHLGKRLLVKPLYGQLEQKSNALALARLGFGTSMERLDAEVIDKWLTTAPRLLPMNYPRTAEQIAKWIDAGHWHTVDSLARLLWQNIPLDQSVDPAQRAREKIAAL
jgi:uncharacterized protein (TIGR00661 family)